MENKTSKRGIYMNILFLFLVLMNLSCNNSENKVRKISDIRDSLHFDYSNFKRTTFEKAKEVFILNEKDIVNFTLEFQNQESIERLSRNDYSLLEIDSSFDELFPGVIEVLSYSLKLKNIKSASIIVNEEYKLNEENFWMNDYSQINTSENISLKNFLEQNNITEDYVKKCINFLRKYKFFSIRKILNTDIIEIRIRISDGILFNPKNEKNPESYMFAETKLINPNWFYFTEYKKY